MSDDKDYLTPLQREYLERNPDVEATREDLSGGRSLTGVAGWLALLAVSLTALGPLFTLATTASEIAMAEAADPALSFNEAWRTLTSLSWMLAGLYCIISIYAGWRLFRRPVPATVPIVIACIWVAGPGLALATLLFVDRLFPAADMASAGASLGRPVIYSIVWTAYLLASKRVRNTYRAETAPRRPAELQT